MTLKLLHGKFTLANETEVYFSVYVYTNRTVNEDVTYTLNDLQSFTLNLGSLELAKIGTYADYIYKKWDGNWYRVKYSHKITVNGSESGWEKASDTSYRNNSIFTGNLANSYITGYCNKLSHISGIILNYNRLSHINDGIGLNFKSPAYWGFNSGISITDFKTWLSNNPVTIYGVYATPTETQITDATLISQLNAIEEASGYAGTTYITVTNATDLAVIPTYHYNFVTPAPSPDRSSEIEVVTGENTITIANSDNTQSQTYTINLGSIELCKIGNYQDEIIKKSDGWYKRAEIGKTTDTAGSTSKTISDMVADSGIYSLYGGTLSGQTVTYTKAIPNTNTIYYPLATPTETKITDATLVSQLEAIEEAEGYRGTNYINSTNSSNELPIIFTFYYDKISEGIRVVRSRTRIIVQRKKKPDISLELEIGDIELVRIDNDYQDKIFKDLDTNKWYLSKKTAKIASYNGESIITPYLSSKTTLETGALVYYGVSETLIEITDTTLKTRLDSILDIELDREETKFIQEVDKFNMKSILYIKASVRKVELVVEETDRIMGFVDGLEAVKQAVYHILMTERYSYLIYDKNYGVELNQYIGRGFDYLKATIEQTLREALVQDLRITNVFVDKIKKHSNDIAEIIFTVQSIYGDLQMEVNVNV